MGDRTVAQLLSHTAGLQAETGGPWWERTPGGDLPAVLAGLDAGAVQRGPGRRFHYSNLGYGLLGGLVERLRGQAWGACLATEVLGPLGMTRTTLRPQPPHARGWAVHPFADVVLPEPEHDAGAMAPAGQVWSTLTDLARLATLLAGADTGVLDPATVAEMAELRTADEAAAGAPGPAAPPAGGYGLGVQVWWHGERRLVGHGGSMPGFLAAVQVDRGTGEGALVLANATAGLDPTTGTDLLDLLAHEEPLPPPVWRPGAVDPAALELVGPWFWGPAALALRHTADGTLHLGPLGTGRARASRFTAAGDGTWRGLDGYWAGETLRPVRHPDGTLRHLDLASFVLTRTPYDPGADVPGGVDPAGWR